MNLLLSKESDKWLYLLLDQITRNKEIESIYLKLKEKTKRSISITSYELIELYFLLESEIENSLNKKEQKALKSILKKLS